MQMKQDGAINPIIQSGAVRAARGRACNRIIVLGFTAVPGSFGGHYSEARLSSHVLRHPCHSLLSCSQPAARSKAPTLITRMERVIITLNFECFE